MPGDQHSTSKQSNRWYSQEQPFAGDPPSCPAVNGKCPIPAWVKKATAKNQKSNSQGLDFCCQGLDEWFCRACLRPWNRSWRKWEQTLEPHWHTIWYLLPVHNQNRSDEYILNPPIRGRPRPDKTHNRLLYFVFFIHSHKQFFRFSIFSCLYEIPSRFRHSDDCQIPITKINLCHILHSLTCLKEFSSICIDVQLRP